MIKHLLMRILAIITALFAYITSLMGAIVTATGSGRGCGGSWPLCHGQLIPDSMSINSFIEYSHRVVSGGDGFFIFVLVVWSWWEYRRDLQIKISGFLSLFFVVLQGALGALTVVYEGTFAKSSLLSLHFGFSLISLASVVLLTIRIFQLQSKRTEKAVTPISTRSRGNGLRYAAWALTVYTYIVVYTGALVEHTGAVTGCGHEIPGCGSTYLPTLASLAGIQVLHRYAASLIGLLILAFMIVVMRFFKERRDLLWGSIWAFILVALQGLSGMLTVITGEQLMVSLLHTTIVSVLFSVLCYLCVQVGWPWQKRALPEQASMAISVDAQDSVRSHA